MKLPFLLCIFYLFLGANDSDALKDSTLASSAPIVVEDTSGMSKEEVREKAKKNDAKVKKKEELNTAIDAMLDGKFDELVKKEKTWEELSPTPKNYDWIQTKSGEWFKGYIKAMFDKKLEFDSDEINMHTFKFKNIKQIKSYQIIGVNIDKVAIFEGIVRLKGDKVRIIQGNNEFEFHRDEVISFAQSGAKERNHWYMKATVSVDYRSGNIDKTDYAAQVKVKRRTADTRLVFDYLGRYSSVSDVQTVSDHRLSEKYDIYLEKDFYWTPLFSEIYQDKFKNIDYQVTAGAGIGYYLTNNNMTEWELTTGPAVIHTNYISVSATDKSEVTSLSAEFGTRFIHEVNKKIDFTYTYKFTVTNKASGLYKHHMLAKLENDITKWLDFDITTVWDYVQHPIVTSSGLTPKQDDFQILIGLGIEY